MSGLIQLGCSSFLSRDRLMVLLPNVSKVPAFVWHAVSVCSTALGVDRIQTSYLGHPSVHGGWTVRVGSGGVSLRAGGFPSALEGRFPGAGLDTAPTLSARMRVVRKNELNHAHGGVDRCFVSVDANAAEAETVGGRWGAGYFSFCFGGGSNHARHAHQREQTRQQTAAVCVTRRHDNSRSSNTPKPHVMHYRQQQHAAVPL